ncbi:MAG: TonB-dependent receptor [Flavobacteriales bacterium]|nr:TonB-dependent receptor [Flavobacteriales bacterium]
MNIRVLILFIISLSNAYSQTDSAVSIPLFEIKGYRLESFKSGEFSTIIDKSNTQRFENLGQVLSESNEIFIKSYGIGSIATSSMRGGSSSHTAVLWNGFNINNSLTGLSDLSLINTYFVDETKLSYGGASALWGSGAVGGAIHLRNSFQFGQGLSINSKYAIGSFSSESRNINLEWSGKKYVLGLGLSNNKAENDFEFQNPFTSDEKLRRLQHAGYMNNGLHGKAAFILSSKQLLSFNIWYQDFRRNLPGTFSSERSEATQRDQFLRLAAEWKNHFNDQTSLKTRAGYFNELVDYQDPLSNISSENRLHKIIFESEAQFRLSDRDILNPGFNNTVSIGVVDSYQGQELLNETAIFAAYHRKGGKIHFNVSGRQGLLNGTMLPLVGHSDILYQPLQDVKLRAKVSRDFRTPTLNDLYWEPGGNPDLRPESGYGLEAGLDFTKDFFKKSIELEYSGTLFSRLVNDWIIWYPNGVFWSPQNIAKVWSRGVENRFSLNYKSKHTDIKSTIFTNYVLSTNRSANQSEDIFDRQLIYVPMYSASWRIDGNSNGFLYAGSVSYNGYRYTSSDNFEYLDPFMLFNAEIGYRLENDKYNAQVRFGVYNILDEDYILIRNRPMPGRNFKLTLLINYLKPLKQ